jgi:hypothetical protein
LSIKHEHPIFSGTLGWGQVIFVYVPRNTQRRLARAVAPQALNRQLWIFKHAGQRTGISRSAGIESNNIVSVVSPFETLLPTIGQRIMIFAPTNGAAIRAGYCFLWVRCPACRTINAIDLRTLDRHRDAAMSSLIPALSCRSCRPNAPFAELVRLSRTSIADEMREEHRRRMLGE